jgi:acidic leucine-rich nuclear phosphoprotein 32 family member B
VAASLE